MVNQRLSLTVSLRREYSSMDEGGWRARAIQFPKSVFTGDLCRQLILSCFG